jgi:HlyD family secretion protein
MEIENQIAVNRIKVSELEEENLKLRYDIEDKVDKIKLNFFMNINSMLNSIYNWEKKYIIKSPISGIVSFHKYLAANSPVFQGDNIITVIPKESGKILGRLKIDKYGAGLVEVGQTIFLKLDNYPHSKYGMIKGKINSITLISTDNYFPAIVELPQVLKTTSGMILPFQQNLTGSAEIITEDIRLIERIMGPIASFF